MLWGKNKNDSFLIERGTLQYWLNPTFTNTFSSVFITFRKRISLHQIFVTNGNFYFNFDNSIDETLMVTSFGGGVTYNNNFAGLFRPGVGLYFFMEPIITRSITFGSIATGGGNCCFFYKNV